MKKPSVIILCLLALAALLAGAFLFREGERNDGLVSEIQRGRADRPLRKARPAGEAAVPTEDLSAPSSTDFEVYTSVSLREALEHLLFAAKAEDSASVFLDVFDMTFVDPDVLTSTCLEVLRSDVGRASPLLCAPEHALAVLSRDERPAISSLDSAIAYSMIETGDAEHLRVRAGLSDWLVDLESTRRAAQQLLNAPPEEIEKAIRSLLTEGRSSVVLIAISGWVARVDGDALDLALPVLLDSCEDPAVAIGGLLSVGESFSGWTDGELIHTGLTTLASSFESALRGARGDEPSGRGLDLYDALLSAEIHEGTKGGGYLLARTLPALGIGNESALLKFSELATVPRDRGVRTNALTFMGTIATTQELRSRTGIVVEAHPSDYEAIRIQAHFLRGAYNSLASVGNHDDPGISEQFRTALENWSTGKPLLYRHAILADLAHEPLPSLRATLQTLAELDSDETTRRLAARALSAIDE